MFYLSREHYTNEPFLVANLVGIAIEGMGWQSAQVVLEHSNLTPEQLERFASDLEALPRRMTLYSELEHNLAYTGLQMLQNLSNEELREIFDWKKSEPFTDLSSFFLWLFGGSTDGAIPRYLTLLPFDRNIAGRRITEFHHTARQMSGTSAWDINSIVAKRHFENIAELSRERAWQMESRWNLLRVPLIRTRSQMIGDYMIGLLTPALVAAENAIDRTNTHFDLLRIAIALERYKMVYENYPQALDDLVPQFLEDVPLDPFTGRKTFSYMLSPDDETAVLLHSSQWDESDGRKAHLFIRLTNESRKHSEVERPDDEQ
jgi:hypothetical protein